MFKRIISVILALALAAALFAFAACSKKDGDNDQDANNTEQAEAEPTAEATEEPTPEPTEAPADYSMFDDAFARFETFLLEPGVPTMRDVMPADFFNGLQEMMDATLAEAGMAYSDMGYNDFDSFLADLIPPETFGEGFEIEGLEGKAVDYVFEVRDCAEVDPDLVLSGMGDMARFFAAEKITAAYRLAVDISAENESGASAVMEGKTLFAYVYDGIYYIGFFSE